MTNSHHWANMDQLRIVSLFLHSKLVTLLHALDIGKLFGAVSAVMQVVEYQFMQGSSSAKALGFLS